MNSPNILIVDDDPHFLRMAKAYLAAFGFTVIPAGDPAVALDLLTQHIIAAVLTDLEMPGMHGMDLARKIREAHPNIPIIVLSGSALTMDRVSSDVNSTFLKSMPLSRLCETLSQLLNTD
jgi:CheY-like chemotaxis protein